MVRAILVLCAAAIGASGASAKVEIGATVGKFEFKDIRYVTRTLTDLGEAKAYVLVFSSTTCPVAQRYIPKINELARAYSDQGVRFAIVNASPGDTIQQMAYHALEYKIDVPVVKDLDGGVVEAIGATRTPEAALISANGTLLYRGRIDDQYRVSGQQPNLLHDDLKAALDATLAGKPIEAAETPVEGCEITFPATPKPAGPVTFAKDVAPILQKNCMPCHHEGEATPFALSTYEQASAKADMIAQVVDEGRMPPWYAHPDFGTWANARTLTASDRRTIVQWIEGGKQTGDLAAIPAPPDFPTSKWIIGEPDLLLTEEDTYELPASGVIDYVYVTLPYQFPEDTWVQRIQVQPSNPKVVHHANALYTVPPAGYQDDKSFLTGRVPGGSPAIVDNGVAFLIPKGAVITVQVHYVTTGKPETNRISVGFQYAKETVCKQLRHKLLSARGFTIPPGHPAAPVSKSTAFEENSTVLGLFIHMHLRGKNSTFTAQFPDGKLETLLVVPNYSFDWQLAYVYPHDSLKKLPAGTTLECASQFDNSAFNPFNPDPTKAIEHGPQTFDEMMDGYVFYTLDNENLNIQVDPKTGQEIVKTADAR
ncbi:MAG: redoxin domain-containing protein [Candidatus Hydrogenedentes bacterium]|nr:redoxin domain-containing protein [Candidatus Hydrogenedentota bacterium]